MSGVPSHHGRVLVVDDEPDVASALSALLTARGFECDVVSEPARVAEKVETFQPEAVVLDYAMPVTNGLIVLARLRERDSSLTVVMLSGEVDIPTAILAMRAGAEDVQTKPVDCDLLIAALERGLHRTRALRAHRIERTQVSDPYGLLDDSPAMHRILRVVDNLAQRDSPVMIVGEPGTGKRAIAEMVHQLSPRCGFPFSSVACSSLDASRLERMLLGGGDGDVDSRRDSVGLMAQARGGTLLLEEPSHLSERLQDALIAELNAALNAASGANVRIICATHRELHDDVRRGTLRADLYHRLAAIPIVVPPLRVRGADAIRVLAERFLQAHRADVGEGPTQLSAGAMQELIVAPWPGNVRQLRTVLAEAFALALDEEVISSAHVRATLDRRNTSTNDTTPDLSLRAMERDHVARVLALTRGQRSEAARLLGITRTTLYKKIEDYGLNVE